MKKVNLILSGHMHNGLILKKFDKRGNVGFISPHKKLFILYCTIKSFMVQYL